VSAVALLVVLAVLPAQGGEDPGAAVRALLSAKCVDCHHAGSTSRKARRAFDGMDDLQRILDEEYVMPGDPALSDLWLTVEDGEMPPDDSEVPPLDDAEKEALRAWILAGAPLPEDGDPRVPLPDAVTGGDAAAAPGVEAEVQDTEEAPPTTRAMFLERLEQFAARLHPASTHFPIGLLLAAALARILGWSGTRPRLRAAEGYCLLLGALGAAAASGLGWLAAEHGTHDPEIIDLHRWISIGTSGAALLLVLARPFAAATRTYGWLLLVMAAALCVTGHYGGELAWGDDGPRLELLFPPAADG